MIRKEILAAFREGKLSAAEARERLRRLQLSNACSLLSSGQQGLWMLQKMVPDMYAYNVPLCFRILQQLDIQKLKQAYTLVIEQQLVLTSIILEENGLPYQEIRASMPLAFLHEDISMLPVSDVLAALKQRARRPFSLKDGPLM